MTSLLQPRLFSKSLALKVYEMEEYVLVPIGLGEPLHRLLEYINYNPH